MGVSGGQVEVLGGQVGVSGGQVGVLEGQVGCWKDRWGVGRTGGQGIVTCVYARWERWRCWEGGQVQWGSRPVCMSVGGRFGRQCWEDR